MKLRAPVWLTPYDVYERHQVVSSWLQSAIPVSGEKGEAPVILDVGGRIDLLAQFLPYRVVSANPDGTGAVVASGLALPFADNSFTAVVNIDTLEHLPPDIRLPLVRECLRVARQYVIIAAPYGSSEHIRHEKEMHEQYQAIHGRSHQYLSEHIRYGLPSPADLERIEQAIAPAQVTRYYAGDYVWQGKIFIRAARSAVRPRLAATLMYLYNRLSSLALFHPVRLAAAPHAATNRFYLFIEKRDAVTCS